VSPGAENDDRVRSLGLIGTRSEVDLESRDGDQRKGEDCRAGGCAEAEPRSASPTGGEDGLGAGGANLVVRVGDG
jgi:hypothetical protein